MGGVITNMSDKELGTYGEDYEPEFQRHILAVLVRIPTAVAQYRTALSHKYFVEDEARIVAKALFDHFDTYASIPTRALLHADAKGLASEEQLDSVKKLVKKLYRRNIADSDAILERVVGFGKQQAMVNAVVDCAGYLETDNKPKILPRIHEAQMVGEDMLNLGIHYNDADTRASWYEQESETYKIPTGIAHLDYALNGGLGRGELGVILSAPKKGKCVRPDTPVWTPDSGYVPMQAVIDGEHQVYGIDSQSQQPDIFPVVSSSKETGKRIVEIDLRSGRTIRGLAETHPVLTARGWVDAGELTESDYVVSASTLPLSGECTKADCDLAWLHGVMCGDGGLTDRSPNLSINHSDYGDLQTVAMIELLHPTLVGYTLKTTENGSRVGISTQYFKLMDDWGIPRTKSKYKRIPPIVWQKGREAVAAFLAGLFDTDGSAYLLKGLPQAEFRVASKGLAEDFLNGLHVLGIYAHFRETSATLGDRTHAAWCVTIQDGESVRRFYEACFGYGASTRKWGILDKAVPTTRGAYYSRLPHTVWERALEAVQTQGLSLRDLGQRLSRKDPKRMSRIVRRAIQRGSRVSVADAQIIGDFCGDAWIQSSASGAYCFDDVVCVRIGAVEDTVDIEVSAESHTFFASGVFTHNSTTLVNFGTGGLRATVPEPNLIDLEVEATARGLNVIHYSMEMKDRKIAIRYDDRLAGKYIKYKKTDNEKYQRILAKRADRLIQGQLFIKSYPTRTAPVTMLRSHLSMLMAQGITPDLVIVDYADIVKAERRGGEFRHEQAGIYEDLRALAGEFDCGVWTASQSNRAAFEKEHVTMADFGESYEKAQIMDVGVALIQTTDEVIDGECRLFLMGVRDAEDQRTIACTIDRRRCYLASTALLDAQGQPVATSVDDATEEEAEQEEPKKKKSKRRRKATRKMDEARKEAQGKPQRRSRKSPSRVLNG